MTHVDIAIFVRRVISSVTAFFVHYRALLDSVFIRMAYSRGIELSVNDVIFLLCIMILFYPWLKERRVEVTDPYTIRWVYPKI